MEYNINYMPCYTIVWDTPLVRGQRPALSGPVAGSLMTDPEGIIEDSGGVAGASTTRLEYIRRRAVRLRRL